MTLRELINSVDSEQYSDRSATKGDACLSKNQLYQKLRETKPEYGNCNHIQVKVVGQAMNTMTLVNKAISIREADRQKKRVYDQCWVVFDKDDFPANDFSQAIQLAEKNGFRVAYSNQAFEYWFLLHYNLYTGPIHRSQYKDMLTKLTGMTYNKTEGFGAVMYRMPIAYC